MSQSTVKVNIKTPRSQIIVKLPVVSVSDDDDDNGNILFDQSLLSFHKLPLSVLRHIEPLQDLVQLRSEINTNEIVKARLILERWFNEDLGYAGYKLRHIIPRSTSTSNMDKNVTVASSSSSSFDIMMKNTTTTSSSSSSRSARKSFAIQRPVERFHTDSTHTAFTNLWLPINHVVTDYFLGFLYDHSSSSLVTYEMLQAVCTQFSTRQQQTFFEENCSILYNPSIRSYGDAIVFRSGGKHGVLHGSFCMHVKNGHRESIEFRCQKLDSSGGWVYGEV